MGDAAIREIKPARVTGGLGSRVLSSARFAVDDDKDIVAYALVTLHSDGRIASCGLVGEESPINRYAFIGMVTEAVREALITDRAAADAINRANGFED